MLSRFLFSFCAVFFFLIPSGAHAVLEISEIMYDVPGSDTGREWIEVYNAGPNSESGTTWKFVENNVRHAIVSERGVDIPPGGYAVIADDATKFLADWPSYAGILFSSSFSLRNKGEALQLLHASSTAGTPHSYAPESGAGGNGNTLNAVAGVFVERAPTPGAAVAPAPLVKKQVAGNQAVQREVQNSDSADDSGAVSISKSTLAGAGRAFEGGGTFGMMPWILALVAVIALGAGALFFGKKGVAKETGSGYRIIEEK